MARGKKAPPDPILEELREAASNDLKAVEFLEARRWGGSPICPYCESRAVYKMVARDGQRNQHFRWRCKGCRKMFTVRTNTVMAESRLPLRIWVHAFWRAASSKKGISALQLSRECDISYKSSLFLLHRLREAVRSDVEDKGKLGGAIEIDETYLGGRSRRGARKGRGRSRDKIPVMALVERDGNSYARVIPDVSGKTLKSAIREMAQEGSRLITDEWRSYRGAGKEIGGTHETVNHGRGEYARGDVHTNTVECWFSLLKRGVIGTFHNVSRKHLHRYCDEFCFRWDTRRLTDAERASLAIKASEGKRLRYVDQLRG